MGQLKEHIKTVAWLLSRTAGTAILTDKEREAIAFIAGYAVGEDDNMHEIFVKELNK